MIVEPLESVPEGIYLQLTGLASCHECSTWYSYRRRKDAMDHLWENHCSEAISLEKSTASKKKLKESIVKLDQAWSHQCKISSLRLLRDIKSHYVEVVKLQKDVAHGVLKDGTFDSSVYRMPSAVVRSFEYLVQLVVYAAFIADAACARAEAQRGRSVNRLTLFVSSKHAQRMLILGFESENSMMQAQHQLVLMTNTRNNASRVGFEAVGPDFIATMIMNNLHSTLHMSNGQDLLTIFRDCLSKLVRTRVLHLHQMANALHACANPMFRNTKSTGILVDGCSKTSIAFAKKQPPFEISSSHKTSSFGGLTKRRILEPSEKQH